MSENFDLTRTSTSNLSARLETASTDQRSLVWGLQFANGISGSNSVTFSPYSHDGWRRLIAQGSEVTSRIDGVKFEINDRTFIFLKLESLVDISVSPPVDYGVSYKGVKGSALAYADVPSVPTITLDHANAQALSSLAQKTSQAYHTLQGGTVLGELRETLGMIRHPGQAIYRGVGQYLGGLKKVIHGTKPRSRKRADVIAESWLEYSFGWKPLFNDIKDGAKALAQINLGRVASKTVRATGSDFAQSASPVHGVDSYGPVSVKYSKAFAHQASVRYSSNIVVKTPDVSGGVLQILGLDMPNFLPTLWELIPYSFLVDYFTNVGNVVQAIANPTSSVNWTVKGTSRESTCSVDIDCVIGSSGNPIGKESTLAWQPATGASVKRKTVTRESYQGSYIPSIQFQLPGMGLKWLNLGALAVTHRRAIQEVSK